MEKKTCIYECHAEAGGKMVPFAGYLLPVQYETGVIAEHMAVRTKAGLFDVSHMGEIVCRGKDALANLNYILTNDFTKLADGQARYSPMCCETGGILDDLIVYKIREEAYLIVVNASNREKDFDWMKAHEFGEAEFFDISDDVAQLALQGPAAGRILRKAAGDTLLPEKYYHGIFNAEIEGMRCLISRTGYTGEEGFEIYLPPADGPKLWKLLLSCGGEEGLIPCGLGARDTLRLEAGMPLYGHEMNETISPLEAGLGFAVKLSKEDFIGREVLGKNSLPDRIRVGLRVTGRGIVREQMEVRSGEETVGFSTSGTHLPFVGYPGAMALVDRNCSAPGTPLTVLVRGRAVETEVVQLPFYKRQK